jgi:UDP-2,3-diacylglucosamine hydrolase
MSKLGIIAAKGSLVEELVEYAVNTDGAFIVALEGEADPKMVSKLDHIWVKLGEVGKAVTAMKEAGVKEVVIIGSLYKPDIFKIKVDFLGAKLLAIIAKNKFFGDNNLFLTIAGFLENQGFKLIGVHEILRHLVVEEGVFTKIKPDAQDEIDIELGIEVVRQLGKLDIGQSAIVENKVVLSVEAIEGTDALIQRSAEYKRDNKMSGILVKFSKPDQELRIDLPTIGINTIKNLHEAGFKGLIIESKKTIFLDQEKVIEYANKHKMFVGARK